MRAKKLKLLGIALLFLVLPACTPPPPNHADNICSIFKQYPRWYWATQNTQKRWKVPISVQMAIIHQESSFNGKAKPDRQKLLWVIPWKRPSSAYGYSQALQQTWEDYQRHTGNRHNRDSFAAASDFIGWYSDQAYKKAGIAKNDAYSLYLAYHDGIGGYQQKTYRKKSWLIAVAGKVQKRANVYQSRLNGCQSSLKKRWWLF